MNTERWSCVYHLYYEKMYNSQRRIYFKHFSWTMATRIDTVFPFFGVDTTISRKILDSFLKYTQIFISLWWTDDDKFKDGDKAKWLAKYCQLINIFTSKCVCIHCLCYNTKILNKFSKQEYQLLSNTMSSFGLFVLQFWV